VDARAGACAILAQWPVPKAEAHQTSATS
jgi:hypothetical protein